MTMSSGHPHAQGHTDVGQGGEEAVTGPPARTGAHRGARRHTKRARTGWVRARNEIGSGVRTLAVVRTVLTTITTLTTPLRHVILLGFVV